jgi:hypothetical protein
MRLYANLAAFIAPRYDNQMSYVVVKTIKGRRYRYLQTSWREGCRVRTKSVCLGPLDGAGRTAARKRGPGRLAGFLKAQQLAPEDHALAVAQRLAAEVDRYQREKFGETAAERAQRERQEHLGRLHDLYGLRLGPANPMPSEKISNQSAAAPERSGTEPDAAESEAGNVSQ